MAFLGFLGWLCSRLILWETGILGGWSASVI